MDTDRASLGTAPEEIERRLTPATAAVVVVHIGGLVSARMPEIERVCARRGVPLVEDAAHARNALDAARGILACVAGREFAGERIGVRSGINTGLLVAGNVGGGGRQSYTVHGDTVNLAARLEALCKEHGTSLLLSASTANALPETKLVAVGDLPVRGLARPVTVFSIPN